MEAHLVHADKAGNLAVVAEMFKEGAENKEIEQLWQKMPKKTGQKITLSGEAKNVMQLLPEGKSWWIRIRVLSPGNRYPFDKTYRPS